MNVKEIDLEEALRSLGAQNLARRGDEINFSCMFPEHYRGDRHPSAYMNTESGIFHCFSCGRKGNLVTMVSQLENISPAKASKWIAQHFDLDKIDDSEFQKKIEALINPVPDAPRKSVVLKESVNDRFKIDWHRVAEAEKIPKPLRYPFERGFDAQTLEDWQIGFDKYSKRITIPYRNRKGELVGFKGRTTKGEFPKYKSIGDAKLSDIEYGFSTAPLKKYVFGIDTADQDLILVEGEFDCIWLRKLGFQGAISLGNCEISAHQEKIIKSFARTVTILFDQDEPGQKGAEKVAEKLYPYTAVAIATLSKSDPSDAEKTEIEKTLETKQEAIQKIYINKE